MAAQTAARRWMEAATMRLIDANKFLKEILTAGIGKTIIEYSESDIGYMIRRQPTVDAAEVLRSQWISVTDGLPESEEEVLVLTVSKTGNVNVDKGYLLNGRFVHRGSAVVTHWMPLPEPPEVDKP